MSLTRLLPAAGLAAIALAACGEGEATIPGGGGERPQAAAAEGSPYALKRIGEFRNPVWVTQPRGVRDLLFVAEKRGVIRVLEQGERRSSTFLDLRSQVNSTGTEQGLTSIAFAPGYRRTGRFYVAYTARGGDLRVEEYRRRPNRRTRAKPASRRRVLEIRQPDAIHNGGLLLFGPDGRLYIGAGDGGPSYDPENRGQSRKTLLGKILRIDPRRAGPGRPYSVPRGNPFRGRGGRDEIYAYGLRNPWRFSFDQRNGALVIADVGQDSIEEIDYVRPKRARGANFGWSGWEGTRPFKPSQQHGEAVRPLHEYAHGEDRCSITGGYVVRTPSLPSLRGRYLYGDYCDGRIRSLVPPSGGSEKDDGPIGVRVPALVSFGRDDRGWIYVVSLEGPVYRLFERRGR